jgi:ATP-binding cassette subfamily F protein 3
VWKERIIVVVSHDRAFLDQVCSDVLHISGAARRLTQSHGNYTLWAARRAEQQAAYAKEAMLRGKEVDRMKEFAGTRKLGATRIASGFRVGFHFFFCAS